MGSGFYLFSADRFIANRGKESSVYSKPLIGSGVGGKGKKQRLTLLENKLGKTLRWVPVGAGWEGEKRRPGHPVQTHIKRQLKKASS